MPSCPAPLELVPFKGCLLELQPQTYFQLQLSNERDRGGRDGERKIKREREREREELPSLV